VLLPSSTLPAVMTSAARRVVSGALQASRWWSGVHQK
jgi:hypothetical protein